MLFCRSMLKSAPLYSSGTCELQGVCVHMCLYLQPRPAEPDDMQWSGESADEPTIDSVTLDATAGKEQAYLNVLGAAVASKVGALKLVQALCEARPNIDPVRHLRMDANGKLQTPLSMAVVKANADARPPQRNRYELAKVCSLRPLLSALIVLGHCMLADTRTEHV